MPEVEIAPVPPQVLDLVGACVSAVANATRVELDFTQDTLPVLDHYLGTAKGPRDEIIGLVAPMCGAYFGEVVRRALGGCEWHAPVDDFEGFELRFPSLGVVVRPVAMALEAILGRDVPGAVTLEVAEQHVESVRRGLELFGDVRDDDFYRLAIRFEAVEQVVTTVTAAIRNRAV